MCDSIELLEYAVEELISYSPGCDVYAEQARELVSRLRGAEERISSLESQLATARAEAREAALREAMCAVETIGAHHWVTTDGVKTRALNLIRQLLTSPPPRVDTVTLLIGKQTGAISVLGSREEAEAARDRLNETHEEYGVGPDADYPYRVETWSVHGTDERDEDSALRLAVKQMRADCLDCLEVRRPVLGVCRTP
jgi:hypothetical protein